MVVYDPIFWNYFHLIPSESQNTMEKSLSRLKWHFRPIKVLCKPSSIFEVMCVKKELIGFRETQDLFRPYLLISQDSSRLQPDQLAPHTGHVKVKKWFK